MTTEGVSRRFAEQILALGAARLDPRDVEQVGRLLLDFAGCAYGGSRQAAAAGLRAWAGRYAGTGSSGIIGGGPRVSAPIAALVNGTAAHSYELDDTHDPSMSHPGSVVIPAALAVAAEAGSRGRDVIGAIVAGYEAMTRIGVAVDAAGAIEYGFHPTALFGGFGAAAAAAVLWGLDADALLCAWGHVLSLAGGAMQFADEPKGTAVKRVHAGYASHHGVLAVELTRHGVEAPRQPLEGRYGALRLWGHDTRPEALAVDAGRLAVHEISLKPYACCRQFHSMIDGLREVTDNFSAAPRIRRITVRGPRVLAEQHMLRRPASPMAAQYSLPFVVGATIHLGPERFDAFTPSYLDNEAILRWADLVQVEHDAELQAQYPAHFGSEVSVALDDGSVRTARVLDSVGTPARPLSPEQIAAKVRALCADAEPRLDVDALRAAIAALPERADVRELDELLTASHRTAEAAARPGRPR